MRAALRLSIALVTAALALGPVPALAQQIPAPTTNAPAADSVGPRDLQGFSLRGTVTQRSDQPVEAPAATQSRTTRSPAPSNSVAADAPTVRRSAAPVEQQRTQFAARKTASTTPRQTPPQSEAVAAQPPISNPPPAPADVTPASAPATPAFAPEPAAPGLAPDHKLPLLPWLLAALALGAGGGFLFWRNRSRVALADGPQIEAFSTPEPIRAPRPAEPPRAAPPVTSPPPAAPGIVSSRLRPWVEVAIQPVRCVLENDQVAIEFDLDLFNSGSAPARNVFVEAKILSAGADQDRELDAFFSKPAAAGEGIPAIPPLQRLGFRTQIAIGLSEIQAFEAAERRMILPLLALNADYGRSGGEGRTSVAYLLGREAKGEKMAPFRIDLGPRIFRGLDARLLPNGVRR